MSKAYINSIYQLVTLMVILVSLFQKPVIQDNHYQISSYLREKIRGSNEFMIKNAFICTLWNVKDFTTEPNAIVCNRSWCPKCATSTLGVSNRCNSKHRSSEHKNQGHNLTVKIAWMWKKRTKIRWTKEWLDSHCWPTYTAKADVGCCGILLYRSSGSKRLA